jgi:hypothetical protein
MGRNFIYEAQELLLSRNQYIGNMSRQPTMKREFKG